MSKKFVIVALMAVLAIGASVAQATPSRMDTLGQNTGLVYLQDDTNIFANPADLANYRKMVWLHMGDDSSDLTAYGGLSLGIGEMLTLGIIVGRNPSFEEGGGIGAVMGDVIGGSGGGYPANFLNHWNASALPNYSSAGTNAASITGVPTGAMVWMNPIDLMLAVKLGNINLGASWYYANGKATNKYTDDFPTDTDEKQTAKLTAWKFGLSTTMGNLTPEVWFHYSPFHLKSVWNDNVADTDATRKLDGRNFDIGAHVIYKMSDHLVLVPKIDYNNISASAKIDTNPDFNPTGIAFRTEGDLTEKYTGGMINAGIGINYSIDKLLVATSVGLQWFHFKQELSIDGLDGSVDETTKWIAIPVVGIGLEYQATKVLVLRGGIARSALYTKSTDITQADVLGSLNYKNTNTISAEAPVTANLGLGLHFGNLVLDLTAGDMIIQGEAGSNNLFSAADLTYKF
jgi:hypothetical protein